MADIEDIIRAPEARFIEADAQARVCFIVKCEHAGCDHELLVPRPQLKGGASREKAAKTPAFIHAVDHAMERAGWMFRRHRSRPLCPDHHPRITHAPKEPAPVADIPARELNGHQPAPPPAHPRLSTRADNLRITDELDAHYDRDAGRYKGNCSDEKVAKKLDVPRAWVSTIRKGFFGDDDRNEALEDDKTIAAALELLAEADTKVKAANDANNKALELVGEARGDVSRARSMLDGIRRAR